MGALPASPSPAPDDVRCAGAMNRQRSGSYASGTRSGATSPVSRRAGDVDAPSVGGTLTEHFSGLKANQRRWCFLRGRCALSGQTSRFLERWATGKNGEMPERLDLLCAKIKEGKSGRFSIVGPRLPGREVCLSAPDAASLKMWKLALKSTLGSPACSGLGVEDAVALQGGRCSPSGQGGGLHVPNPDANMLSSFASHPADAGEGEYNPDEEYRIDPTDGLAYTQQQFLDAYGGTDQWDTAEVFIPGEEEEEEEMEEVQAPAAAPPAVAAGGLFGGLQARPQIQQQPSKAQQPAAAQRKQNVAQQLPKPAAARPVRGGGIEVVIEEPAPRASREDPALLMPGNTGGHKQAALLGPLDAADSPPGRPLGLLTPRGQNREDSYGDASKDKPPTPPRTPVQEHRTGETAPLVVQEGDDGAARPVGPETSFIQGTQKASPGKVRKKGKKKGATVSGADAAREDTASPNYLQADGRRGSMASSMPGTEPPRATFERLFQVLSQGNGFITADGLSKVLGAQKAAALVGMADGNGDGRVSAQEWIDFISQGLTAKGQTIDTATPDAVAHFAALFGQADIVGANVASPKLRKRKVKKKRGPGSVASGPSPDAASVGDYDASPAAHE